MFTVKFYFFYLDNLTEERGAGYFILNSPSIFLEPRVFKANLFLVAFCFFFFVVVFSKEEKT